MRIGIGIGTEFSRFASGTSINPDAQTFITAAGITDPTQISALDFLFNSLQGLDTSYNPSALDLYTLLDAFYPIVGGTASTHKFNGKNPVDSDAAYRLAFSGGWTHSANGMLPNGVNSYADTFLAPSDIGLDSIHESYYSRTNNTRVSWDMGISPNFYMNIKWTDNFAYWQANGGQTGADFSALTSQGLFMVNRTNSSTESFFRNKTEFVGNKGSTSASTNKIFIGASNNGSAAFAFSNRECAFASIGLGFTDTQQGVYYDIIQQYQTLLSRNV